MPTDLFRRYWRDVHGVMAARVHGFESYTQYHVEPLTTSGPGIDGIALVTFASEDDRNALAAGPLTPHIHADEQNLFERVFLYSLPEGPRQITGNGIASSPVSEHLFVIVQGGQDARPVLDALAGQADHLAIFDLTRGDPALWNTARFDDAGVPAGFSALIHAAWGSSATATSAAARLAALPGGYLLCRSQGRFAMVEGGRPTAIGLRGLPAVQTIEEAGAINQLSPEIEQLLFPCP
ncbi:EthD domain-containing protein [Novosphingobium sp. KCTC 2891]|uniref:EthD domain-containing protein n=1 Tax=Novosphingobium sp. KCTC 2891 TaxID=2989730 RepID=UPI002223BEE6|nr:EthD domain-containing protein [Novosphingobium sp. KCTC 2891]MCW1383781.1 EthD domain-containing protein [Novosphingobium sp. KCTC 2891]